MSPGVLGCYLSHVHVYENIVLNRIPVALVLEDDAVKSAGCWKLESGMRG
jgi:GR25 family glycosyltransferase involved in LPS biosynthesis